MSCSPCEYDLPERSPQTLAGWRCWEAGMSSFRRGWDGLELDMAGAVSLARDLGVHPRTAVPLLREFAAGMMAKRSQA